MLTKYLLCCVLCAIATCDVKVADDPGEYSPHELPCLTFGGICVPAGDCPIENLAQIKGLCPVQQKYGVECCHGIPKSATRCRERGGECFPNSYGCKMVEDRATDCDDDETCCILVK